jgi:hypothetical protein
MNARFFFGRTPFPGLRIFQPLEIGAGDWYGGIFAACRPDQRALVIAEVGRMLDAWGCRQPSGLIRSSAID